MLSASPDAVKFLPVPFAVWIFGLVGLSASQMIDRSWDIAVIDQVLADAGPGQEMVAIGDMGFKVTVLKAWRDHLASASSRSPSTVDEEPDSAFAGGVTIWTNGKIPYTFDPAVTGPHQQAFLDAAGEWAMFANLHFVPRTVETNYLVVQNAAPAAGEGGISSGVGMVGGMQSIQIGTNSWNRGTLCHEIGHVLGMVHEHQRSDRDNFVTIFTANIIGGAGNGNFTLLPSSLNKGAYDFLSVMHYSRNLQSSNGMDTIEPKTSPIDYSQYLNLMGLQFDRVLSAGDRSGMAQVYGANFTATSPVVTNTWDCHNPSTGLTNSLMAGFGSLRAALYYSVDHPGTTITFNIPTSDAGFNGSVFTIQPTDDMTRPGTGTIIDGTTQTGGTGNPVIVLDGAYGGQMVGVYEYGLRISDANCAVRGLQFSNFSASGVVLFGGASNNVIGGTTSAARNVITGNTQVGIYITDSGTTGNVIEGNYVGVARDGATASPNSSSGVEVTGGAQGNFIGGTALSGANIISGNTLDGVRFDGANVNINVVRQNLIGLKATGGVALPNGGAGVDVYGSAQSNIVGPGNVISGNSASGVIVNGCNGTIVTGNYIGTTSAGSSAVPNSQAGVYLTNGSQNTTVGGPNPGAGNVISGNTGDGIDLNGVSNTTVQGNYVGLDSAGATAMPNHAAGIALFSGATSNTIGGTLAGARNIISGNAGDGLNLNGVATTIIHGNYIGIDVTGITSIGNAGAGIYLFGGTQTTDIGGTAAGSRNFISGNDSGVAISGSGTSGTLIQGNTIGLNVAGTATPNTHQGIAIFGGAQSNTIGGSANGASNVLAGNFAEGIATFDSTTIKNLISRNSIFSNAPRGIGVYTNSSNNQPAPALTTAFLSPSMANPGGTDITGNFSGSASTIEFFASSTGNDEGQFFVGSLAVGGSGNFSKSLAAAMPAGYVITATAADSNGNTSQFSPPVSVSSVDSDGDGIPDNWMNAHFHHPTGQAGDKSRATDDADGTGMTNLQKFRAGLDPLNPNSVFRISSIALSSANIQIGFPSISGKTYQLQYRNDLVTGNWSTLTDQIFGTGATIQVIDFSNSGASRRFYRLGLEP